MLNIKKQTKRKKNRTKRFFVYEDVGTVDCGANATTISVKFEQLSISPQDRILIYGGSRYPTIYTQEQITINNSILVRGHIVRIVIARGIDKNKLNEQPLYG